jgi:hypothetical protein
MRGWLIVGALALTALAQIALAAERPPPLPDSFMNVFESVEKIRDQSQPWYGLRQKLSMVGRDDLIVDLIYSPTARPKCDLLTRSGRPIDPVAEIIGRARSSGRVVIVNEAHDDAQTRALIMKLMRPLHDLRLRSRNLHALRGQAIAEMAAASRRVLLLRTDFR